MRIAQIAPIAERVPPKKYGGTERVIYNLTEELVKRGHDVTLFATGDSITSAKLVSVVPIGLREAKGEDLYGYNTDSLKNMGLAYARQDEFDIIHDHNPHLSLPTANISRTPVVMTWHGPYTQKIVDYFRAFDHARYVSISDSQRANVPLNFYGTVYNGLNLTKSPFSATRGDYMLFVGRIDKEKGTHIAMDAAARTGRKLIIAGKLERELKRINEYYLRSIKPRLDKYKDLVTIVGEVDEAERNTLMKNAYCVLHPVTWPEPFGLTLIESMACGTPVVGYGLGSIPEVINNGVSGFVVNTFKELLAGIAKIPTIERKGCRDYALANFNAQRMADGYEAIYQKALAEKDQRKS